MVISAGTVKVGGRIVFHRDHLYMWVVLPQSSVRRPGPGNDLFPVACAGSDYISVKVASREVSQLSASSVTSPVIARIGIIVAACILVNGDIGRDCEGRGRIVLQP